LCYPNPYKTETQIRFELAEPFDVAIEIFDTAGRRVRVLASGTELDADSYDLPWDGRDDTGKALPAGVYMVRLGAGGKSYTDRVTLLK